MDAVVDVEQKLEALVPLGSDFFIHEPDPFLEVGAARRGGALLIVLQDVFEGRDRAIEVERVPLVGQGEVEHAARLENSHRNSRGTGVDSGACSRK